jgi:acyl-CoA thioester hydrolase
MAVMHTSQFVVREYECDSYGHLNNANYIRFMQEAAFEASAAVGYPKTRYEALGRLWLARETEIEYLRPLYAGDTVEVKTWVADFRQVRSLRRYEFRQNGNSELAARASTDWVYLDRASGQVVSVPSEIIAAYSGGDPVERLPRRPFPAPKTTPKEIYTLRQRVEWRDIDAAQHLNNAAYFNYIEDCAVHVAAHYHWPLDRLQAELGIAMMAARHQIEYLQPARLGDLLDISTWLYAIRRTSATRYYRITRTADGALLAQAQTVWVAVNIHTGRPVRIPEVFGVDFAPNMALE